MEDFTKNKSEAMAMLVKFGFNTTPVQISVMAIMLGAEEPLSQFQIKEIITKTVSFGNVKPDKTTIYRILNKFLNKGLIQRVFINDNTCKYELSSHHTKSQSHPHFKCLDCSRIYCLGAKQATFNIELAAGFVPKMQKIMIEGVCPNCSQ